MSKRTIELLDPKTSMVTEDWENRATIITIVDRIQKIVTILDKFGMLTLLKKLVFIKFCFRRSKHQNKVEDAKRKARVHGEASRVLGEFI